MDIIYRAIFFDILLLYILLWLNSKFKIKWQKQHYLPKHIEINMWVTSYFQIPSMIQFVIKICIGFLFIHKVTLHWTQKRCLKAKYFYSCRWKSKKRMFMICIQGCRCLFIKVNTFSVFVKMILIVFRICIRKYRT